MPITINGSGTVTGISAGGLPDSVITTDDIAANAVTTAKLGSAEASGLAKAWVNFNGTGTVAIRASYNVSSITDNNVGDYTVNFTTAMVDANFSAMGICSVPGASNCPVVYDNSPTRARTTTSVSIRTMDVSNFGDPVFVNVAIFR